jgi:hypothetical protein
MIRRQGVRAFAVLAIASWVACIDRADPVPSTAVTEQSTEQAVTNTCSDPAYPQLVNFATIYGEDGRAVNELIGISYVDGSGSALDGYVEQGATSGACGGYSACHAVNPTLPASGSTTEGVTSLSYCVAANVAGVWIEEYPRDPQGVTDESRYGEADYNEPRNAFDGSGVATLDGRLPMRYDQGGNTGFLRGNVTCDGAPVVPTRLNAWSNDGGTACGIQGFSAGGLVSPTGYNYMFQYLAGGQCYAPSQYYQVQMHADCEGSSMEKTQYAYVIRSWQDSTGAWHGTTMDFAFP